MDLAQMHKHFISDFSLARDIGTAIFLLVLSSTLASAASDIQIPYSKTPQTLFYELAERKPLRFSLTSNQSILISASQRFADISITLISRDHDMPKTLLTLGSPSSYRQPEYIYIHSSQCTQCEIQIMSKNNWERDHQIEVNLDFTDNPNSAFQAMMTHYNQAMRTWFVAEKNANLPSYKTSLIETKTSLTMTHQLAKEQKHVFFSWFSLYQLSVVHHFLGEYELQAKILQDLQYSLTKDNKHQIRILLDLASHAVYELDDLKRANAYIVKALSMINSDKNLIEKAELLELKASLFVKQGKFDLATQTYESTIDLFMAEGDLFSASNSMLSLGWFYFKNGRLLKANQYYRTALALSQRSGDIYNIVNANTKMASVYRLLGELDTAMQHVDIALANSSSIAHGYLDAWAKQEKAILLYETQQYFYAAEMFKRTKEAFTRLNVTKNADKVNLNLAQLSFLLGETKRAENFLSTYINQVNGIQNDYERGLAKTKIATIYLAQGDPRSAFKHQQTAHTLLQESSDVKALALSELNLAQIYSQQGNLALASSLFTSAIVKFEDSKDAISQVAALHAFANAVKKDIPEDALVIAKRAQHLLQSLHQNHRRADLKRGFLAKYQDLFSLIVNLDTRMTREQALIFAESVRATTFENQWSTTESINTNSNKLYVTELSMQMSEELVKVKNASDPKARERHLFNIREISERLYKNEVAELASKKAKAATFTQKSLKTLQNALGDDDLVMFFDVSENVTHVWVLDGNHTFYFTTKAKAVIEQHARSIFESIRRRETNLNALDSAMALSEDLFPPEIKEKLQGKKRLIIIPDGALSSVPFSALPLKDFGLVNQHVSVAYHHSLNSLLKQMQKQNRQENIHQIDDVLVIANPTIKNNRNETTKQNLGYFAPELPFSEMEAKVIEKHSLGQTVMLTRELASKASFLQQPLDSFDVLHFATHGITNNKVPELGGLVLSNSLSTDNLLLTPEIKRLRLNAKLVVLSGCDTATGALIVGEGLMGLSRAFMQSGAQNVMGTLWKVQDDATAVLMSKFYENKLVHNMEIGAALIDAQQHVKNYRRKDGKKPWSSPFYWAGFVLHGIGK